MGKFSLIFGIIVIGVGLYHAYDAIAIMKYDVSDPVFIFAMAIAAIAIAVGLGLVKKYDSDNKKEKMWASIAGLFFKLSF